MTDRPIILFHDSMKELALEVARLKELETGEIEWRYFDDKWPNFRIKEVEKIRWRNIIFFASFTEPADVFPQLAVLYQFPEKKSGNLHIILPYYPVGTMDRAEEEGEIITSQALAQMLSGIPLSHKGGRHLLTVFDIHAAQERSYFNGNVIFDAQTAVSLLLSRTESMVQPYNDFGSIMDREKNVATLAVALPDEGAFKRFGKKLPGWLHLVKCDKVRDGANRKIIIKEGDPRGRHVIIIDDLVNSGKTLIECRHELVKAGAVKVSAFVPHGVFPKKAWRKITPELFGNFWITDSCPQTARAVKGAKPFHVISLTRPIARIIGQ